MTRTAFNKLKAGFILRWPSGLVRTITEGPADKGGSCISVPRFGSLKQHRLKHHFQRLTVTYVYDDLPREVRVIGRTKKLCLLAERLRLTQLGFNLKQDAQKYADWHTSVDQAFGRKVCARALRLVGEISQ